MHTDFYMVALFFTEIKKAAQKFCSETVILNSLNEKVSKREVSVDLIAFLPNSQTCAQQPHSGPQICGRC